MPSNRRPTHPGALLREDIFPALGWSDEQAAANLDVPLPELKAVLNEAAPVSTAMAARLGDLGVIGAGLVARMQLEHDYWVMQRGSGRTTKQILEAPLNAMYLCPPDSKSYTVALTRHLDRSDLNVRAIERTDRQLSFLHGYRFPVIVDHWVELNEQQAALTNGINSRLPA